MIKNFKLGIKIHFKQIEDYSKKISNILLKYFEDIGYQWTYF